MAEAAAGFPWTEEQWSRARQVVQDSARRARVASSFLPLVGPLPADQITVPARQLTDDTLKGRSRGETNRRLEVDDTVTVPLTTISANIYLRTYEAADPEQSSALEMIGRAAEVLGRVEDSIIFNGQRGRGRGAKGQPVVPNIYSIRGGEKRKGIAQEAKKKRKKGGKKGASASNLLTVEYEGKKKGYSSSIVKETVAAIELLERNGHYGPFAEVLGNTLYEAANTPNRNSMVLPSDRILPFLDGPLLRSSTMPDDKGVVVALGGAPIDLVVAQDLRLKFVQMSQEPRYILRLSERFTLRIKQAGAVVVLKAQSKKKGKSK